MVPKMSRCRSMAGIVVEPASAGSVVFVKRHDQPLSSAPRLITLTGVPLSILMGLLVLGAAPLLGFGRAGAQMLPAASNSEGEHLWLLLDGPDNRPGSKVRVLHCAPGDESVRHVLDPGGVVLGSGVSSAGGRLWWAQEESGIIRLNVIVANRSPIGPSWRYAATVEPAFPSSSKLRALAAARSRLWSLVRIDSPEAMRLFNQSLVSRLSLRGTDHRRLNVALGLPPDVRWQKQGAQSESVTQPTPPQISNSVTPTDRLLVLERGSWRLVNLPEDWPDGRQARLVMLGADQTSPILLVRSGLNQKSLWVYGREANGWDKQVYPLRQGATPFVAISVADQLVLAERLPTDTSVSAAISVLRKGQKSPVADLSIDAPPGRPWAVATVGVTVALIVQVGEPGAESVSELSWTRANLLGEIVSEPQPLQVYESSTLGEAGGYVVLVSVLVLATLMILVFWRRDPHLNQVVLPSQLALADLGRRLVAGVIDMAPGFVGAMWFEQIGPQELLARWPGAAAGMSWEGMQPGVIVIAIFLVHSGVSELFTRRSLGKVVTGLRVTTLDGRQPRSWQLLIRNLLKAFDLIAWLLLILPVIGPYRQRLGDMVARTVVVMPVIPLEGGS